MRLFRAGLLAAALSAAFSFGAFAQPFVQQGPTISLAASASSAHAALSPATSSSLWTCNLGGTLAYVGFGDSTYSATVADTPIPSGLCVSISPNGKTYIAAITAGSTTVLSVTPGAGTLSGVANAPATPVGGNAIGAAGAAGTPYSGYVFSGGDDFSSNVFSQVCPTTPNGRYFTQRLYQIFGTAYNGPRGAYTGVGYNGLQGYEIDTCHTGFGDTGRGAALSSYNDMVVQSGGYLALKTRIAATAEISYTNAAEPILSSMISTAGYIVGIPPFISEVRFRYNPFPAAGPPYIGFHPSFWFGQSGGYNSQTGTVVGGVDTNNDFEVDFEGGAAAGSNSPNRYAWANGVPTNFTATGANGSLAWDGNWHTETYVVTATTIAWYVDGNLIRQDTVSTSPFGLRPFFSMLTNHVTNQAGDGFTTGAWTTQGAAGAVTQANYLGWWHAAGAIHRVPVQAQPDINIPWASSWPVTVTLPSAAATWGGAVTFDGVEAIPAEYEDPGVSYAGGAAWDGMPSWITASTNANGTVKLVISQPPHAGRILMARTGGNAGDTVQVQRFTIHVGPRDVTPANLYGITGSAFRYNLATDCDTGGEQKSVQLASLPATWTFATTPGPLFGLLQQASLSASPVSISLICTDTVTGQSVTQGITIGPFTAGTGQGTAPPTFPEGPPLVSLDFDNLPLLTLNGSNITNAAAADGTAFAATQPVGTAPVSGLVGVRDGATFNGTTQLMDFSGVLTSNAAVFKGEHTIIVVATPTGLAGAPSIWVDIGVAAGTPTANRTSLGNNGTSLLFRTGNPTADVINSALSTSGIHLFTARRFPGTPNNLETTVDLIGDLPGYAAPTTSAAISTNPDHATLGARDVASTYTGFAPVVIYKVLIYPWCLTPQEIGQIKNWKVNNYGP